jgi:hypothetical protein
LDGDNFKEDLQAYTSVYGVEDGQHDEIAQPCVKYVYRFPGSRPGVWKSYRFWRQSGGGLNGVVMGPRLVEDVTVGMVHVFGEG